jgi:hypothetical protein
MRTTEILCPELCKSYLQEYFSRDLKHPLNQKIDAIENFRGMASYRPKTDPRMFWTVFSMLVLIAVTFGMSFRRFSIYSIFIPQDFRADYCGQKQLANNKYAYWPDAIKFGTRVKLCVETCPREDNKEICIYDEFNLSNYEDYCFLSQKTIVT